MKYKEKVYDAMKPAYEDFLNDKSNRDELVEMVDLYEPHELFKDLCNWYGMPAHSVKFVYEAIYGKKE